jgi:SAM-dependent methyltransferase
MNRRQRRAAQSQEPASGGLTRVSSRELAVMFERAVQHHQVGEFGAAAQFYKKILGLKPDHLAACDGLAMLYLAQGRLDKASAQFAEMIAIAPQRLAQWDRALDTLKRVLPALAEDLASGVAAPQIAPSKNSPAAAKIGATIRDPLLLTILQGTAVCDLGLERWLTGLRASILQEESAARLSVKDGDVLAFCAALARQCFINEYVFAVTPAEQELVDDLRTRIGAALSGNAPIDPVQLLALAMYVQLSEVPGAAALANREWPAAVAAVVSQQVTEVFEERTLRDTIRRLTATGGDDVTAKVRQQYEENPYPRWAMLAAPPWPLLTLDEHLRNFFPSAPFRPVGAEDHVDILVAGCGTGRHALELAQSYRGAHVLAVDLSIASLASAKRRTPAALIGAIEFAQADIMAIGSIGRSFDQINVTGVLHHMDDPWGGWRELIKLMKPDGVMQVGLYSVHARRDVVSARNIIASRGYPPTPDGVRRLRRDLADSGEKFSFMTLLDYYTVSACRDLLFHVHERQTTIPEIKAFLAENNLRFIGFDFGAREGQEHYRNLFAAKGWSLTDLDRWDPFERENPALFAGMYNFWVQKN